MNATIEVEKSRGHVGFVNGYEYYIWESASNALYMAPVDAPIDSTENVRLGRFECSPNWIAFRLDMLGIKPLPTI